MAPVPDSELECDDKPNECEDLSTPDLVIPHDPDSGEENDGEAESGPYQGYQPLSQDPGDANLTDSEENGHSDDNDTTNPCAASEGTASTTEEMTATTSVPLGNIYPDFPQGTTPTYLQAPDLQRPDKKCLLWNQTKKGCEIQMGQEQEAKVKAAMAGFQLPMSNIPDWARNITDDELKEKLVSKINVDSVNSAQHVQSVTEERDLETPQCSKNS